MPNVAVRVQFMELVLNIYSFFMWWCFNCLYNNWYWYVCIMTVSEWLKHILSIVSKVLYVTILCYFKRSQFFQSCLSSDSCTLRWFISSSLKNKWLWRNLVLTFLVLRKNCRRKRLCTVSSSVSLLLFSNSYYIGDTFTGLLPLNQLLWWQAIIMMHLVWIKVQVHPK